MNQSKIIGLTGGIASGKSTVSKYLSSKGYPIVDADAISRTVVEPGEKGLAVIVDAFGVGILDGAVLNRKKLREMIFDDDEKRLLLNRVLHPIIHEAIEVAFEKLNDSIIVFDVPLLLENELEHMVDTIWVVSCDEETQIKRVMNRDQISKEQAKQIISKQMPLNEKVKHADVVLDNISTLDDLYKQIEKALEALC